MSWRRPALPFDAGRAGRGASSHPVSNRYAASTASTGTSIVLLPRSCRAPVISTTSVGAGIKSAAACTSSMVPKGSLVPWVNTVGTLPPAVRNARPRSPGRQTKTYRDGGSDPGGVEVDNVAEGPDQHQAAAAGIRLARRRPPSTETHHTD